MIQVNELRIGNCVKIGQLYTTICFINGDEDYFDPIPLTPEILEKAGFVYKQTGNEVYEQEWVIDGHCLIWGPTSKDSFCHDMHTGGEIKYLHQLQNLYFALTGEELQIDL